METFFKKTQKRARIKAEITTDLPASSYGQPVIVLDDGGALDLMCRTAMGYRVERSELQTQRGFVPPFWPGKGLRLHGK